MPTALKKLVTEAADKGRVVKTNEGHNPGANVNTAATNKLLDLYMKHLDDMVGTQNPKLLDLRDAFEDAGDTEERTAMDRVINSLLRARDNLGAVQRFIRKS